MKNKLPALFLSLSLLFFTACTQQDTEVNIPRSPDAAVPTDTPVQTDVPDPIDTSVLQTVPPGTTDTIKSTFDTPSEVSPNAPEPVPIPENFLISNYITDFDPIKPAFFSVFEDSDYQIYDEAAEKAAIQAYKSSVYHENALEYAKSLFCYENGVLTPYEDPISDVTESYQDFIGPEFEIIPKVSQSFRGKFDGKNDEYLLMLSVPLPPNCRHWSGVSEFSVPVYINGSGETFILDDACGQDVDTFECIRYNGSGCIHAIFNYGHNEGIRRTTVYSFESGTPKAELMLDSTVLIIDEFREKGVLLLHNQYVYAPFFWNGEMRKYCVIKGEIPNRELAEIICTNEKILEKVPDAWKEYENETVWIVGGKYITFRNYFESSFEYNDGEFEETIVYHTYADLEIPMFIAPTDVVFDEFDYAFNIEFFF